MGSGGSSKPIGGGSPPFQPPAAQAQKGEALPRSEKSPIQSVPVSSIKFAFPKDFSETLKEKVVPLAMQAKASSIFTVKTLMASGTITHMQAALTGVGGLFIGVNLPAGVINTYSLVKNWKTTTKMGRAVRSSQILANTLLTSAGASLLFSKVGSLSALIGPSHAALAGKAAFVLGPAGMAILSVMNLGMGAVSVKKAVGFEALRKEAAAKQEGANPLEKALFSREERRFAAQRDFAVASSVKSFLLGIGIGVGALVMSGIVAGALTTPFGWAAIGLVGAGMAISIGVMVVQKRKAASKEREEGEQLVRIIMEQMDLQGESIEEAVKNLSPHFTDEVLNSSGWPGNPTLLELIEKRFL